LGIALHPQFPATPFVYLYFTESSTGADTTGSPTPLGNHVYRYTWNGSKLTSPTLILALPVSPGPNHNGGVLTFGPDGKLYGVIGDLNLNGQLQNFPSGPPPDDTGVIFRLNDDGTTPSDNPFFSQGGNVAKYYAYGIRNSFGMAFDPVTGNLWMTENGPNLYDEINLVEPGFNSGWEQLMGPDARDPQGVTNLFAIPGAHYRDPSFSWLDTVGPTGLVFLDSNALGPQYLNNMFVGDINGGVLYRFRPDASREGFEFQNPALADLVADNSSELSELVFGTGFGGITDIKVGPDGFLYIVSFSGRILVISPVKPVVTITAPDTTATEAGATTGFFSVRRTGSTASSLTVNYTVGGSASHGVDYNSFPGNVIIPAGASSANIVILPNDDLTVEGNETVVLTLGSHAAYTIGSPASATVTITDNDGSVVSCPAEIIRDNLSVGQSDTFRSFTGTWAVSASTGQFGSNSLYSSGGGLDTYNWKSGVFNPSQACTYRVDV
jgi:glucose/arabinose dehydrogenase